MPHVEDDKQSPNINEAITDKKSVRRRVNSFVFFSDEPHKQVGDKPKGELSGGVVRTSPAKGSVHSK